MRGTGKSGVLFGEIEPGEIGSGALAGVGDIKADFVAGVVFGFSDGFPAGVNLQVGGLEGRVAETEAELADHRVQCRACLEDGDSRR